MGLIELYNNDKTVLNPNGGATYTSTYEDIIFNMERTGVNDLVAMNAADPLFRPPVNQTKYMDSMFKEGVTSNRV